MERGGRGGGLNRCGPLGSYRSHAVRQSEYRRIRLCGEAACIHAGYVGFGAGSFRDDEMGKGGKIQEIWFLNGSSDIVIGIQRRVHSPCRSHT